MNKAIKRLMCLAMLGVVGLSSCNKEPADDNSLKIMVTKLGYGTTWLHELAKVYKEQTGVNVKIQEVVGSSGIAKTVAQLYSNVCDADIYMTRLKAQYAEYCYDGKNHFVDLTDIYNEPYEGENGATMYSKMDPIFRDYNLQNGKYYATQWSTGFMGFVRNLDVWNAAGMQDTPAPRTTEEFFEVLNTLKTNITDANSAPIIYNAKEEYYSSIVGSWFYQYEGKDMLDNFYVGKDSTGTYDPNGGLYDYEGQEESLKILERLLDPTNGYHHKDSDSSQTFTTMQVNFVRGAAAFCLNGTWMEHEIGSSYYNKNLDFVKIPLISSLANKLSFKNDSNKEQVLRELVSYVDEHPAVGDNESFVSPIATIDDLERVREARNGGSLVKTDQDHQVVISSSSTKIDEAKKFIKFMYSDLGLNTYYTSMKGHRLPATPTTGYADIEKSKLQTVIDNINNEGNFCYYEVEAYKSKIYSFGKVKLNFSNGLGTGTCIQALAKTGTQHMGPAKILELNRQDVANRWIRDIQPYL